MLQKHVFSFSTSLSCGITIYLLSFCAKHINYKLWDTCGFIWSVSTQCITSYFLWTIIRLCLKASYTSSPFWNIYFENFPISILYFQLLYFLYVYVVCHKIILWPSNMENGNIKKNTKITLYLGSIYQ